MLFTSIFVYLLCFSIIELLSSKSFKKIFTFTFLIITLLTIFRYGVGTDYFGYMYLYQQTPQVNDPLFFQTELHGEIGYRVLVGLCKWMNLSYETFVGVMTFTSMTFIYFFIKRYTKFKMLSLFIFYSMYYFTYINSGIRQGFAISFFIAVLIPLLLRKKYSLYIILTILVATIHSSILVVLILPLLSVAYQKNKSILFAGIILSIFLIFISVNFIPMINQGLGDYRFSGFNGFALISRFLLFSIIMLIFYLNKHKVNESEKMIILYYFFGFLLYLSLCNMSLVSSRMHVYFKVLEILLIPNFLSMIKINTKNILVPYILIIFFALMWMKEINNALNQGEYNKKNIFLDYKYTSIFNADDVKKYRKITFKID